MSRTINFQKIAWFWDLFNRDLLDLSPPYQRRSVWNQGYKDYFIDTVLNGYPSPAIFIYQEITPEGVTKISVVDGKQRLSSVFEFAQNEFPVYEKATIQSLQGKYFQELDVEIKQKFWGYQFAIEYLPSSNEQIIGNIFDRINRNVSKLTPQELRHAKFSGDFITLAENLASWMFEEFDGTFPKIEKRFQKHMKDVEIVSQLLLFLEDGVKSQNQDYLDKAFSERDINWDNKEQITNEFRDIIKNIKNILELSENINLKETRLKNQADFYSFFGAIAELRREENLGRITKDTSEKIYTFLQEVKQVNETFDENNKAKQYHKAATQSFTDSGARESRIKIMKSVILSSS